MADLFGKGSGLADYRQIPLKSIDWSDDSFSLRFGRLPYENNLRHSIDSIGLLNSPILLSRKDGFQTIICGFARLHALRDLGKNEVTARCMPSDTNQLLLMQMAIADNNYSRGFNRIEQAMAMGKSAAWLSSEQIAEHILPLLGLPPASPQLEKFLSYLKLPMPLQSALAAGELPEGLIPNLCHFEAADQEILLNCMLKLRMTFGTGKEFLRNLNEISKRDATTISDLLQRLGYDGAIIYESAKIPAVRSQFLDKIRQCRYPILQSLGDSYLEHQKALGLAPNISLRPPRDFEGDEYILQARLTNLNDFENLARHLAEQVNRNQEHLRGIFDIEWND